MATNALLNHYKINDPFPETWPADQDADDSNDDGDDGDETLIPDPKPRRRFSKSRYSVLEAKRTSVPGAERTKDGLENLVQKDEPDPLGRSPASVIQTLRRRGVPVDQDSRLRMAIESLLCSFSRSYHAFVV